MTNATRTLRDRIFGDRCHRCGRRTRPNSWGRSFHQRVHQELDANLALQAYIRDSDRRIAEALGRES